MGSALSLHGGGKPNRPKTKKPVLTRRQKQDKGLRYIGKNVHELKQELSREAESLYRDKVLV